MTNGRVALVTGGARGIGRAIAERLVADGHAVAVVDVLETDATVEAITQAGGTAQGFNCDVSARASVATLADEVTGSLGPVDVLAANAGVGPIVPFLETTWEVWRHVMDINVDGVYHVLRTFIPSMAARGWGRVIVTASGVFYAPPPGFSAYIASKGAVIGLVRGVAQEVGASGVTVNCVAPSLTPTPGVMEGPQKDLGLFEMMIQQQAIKRIAQPDDVAKAVSFLASDDAAFISAQVLAADGGAISL